jgi:MYXO-CTERM domain-containing protein
MSRRNSLLALVGAVLALAGIACSTHKHTDDGAVAQLASTSPGTDLRGRPAPHVPLRPPPPLISNGHHLRDFLHGPIDNASPDASNPFPDFWWIGASSTDTSAIPNTGVQFTTQVVSTPAGADGGCFNVWTSDTLDNDYWGQVGYSACNMAGQPEYNLTAFYQVWNLALGNGGTLLVAGNSTELSVGLHNFSMYVTSGTTWAYAVDGNVFGIYDMGSATADQQYGVATLTEEGDGIDAAFVPPVVQMPVAMEVRSGSSQWGPADEALTYNTADLSGVVGHLQSASLANDQIVVGGSAPTLDAGTPLWEGTSTEGGLPTTSDAGPSDPPFLAISCPVAGTTVGGTVNIQSSVTAALGVAEVMFVAIPETGSDANLCTLTAPPFDCAWDTTDVSDGLVYVFEEAVDTQNNVTFEYVTVTVDHTASSPCAALADAGAEDGGPTTDAATAPDAGKMEAGSTDGAIADAGTSDGAVVDGGADAAGSHADGAAPVDGAADGPVLAEASAADAETGDGAASGAGSGKSSGCGCRVAGSDGSGTRAVGALGLLGIAAAIGRRRRRR